MRCEKCQKNEATVFYQETVNGNKRSYSLCGECAAELSKQVDLSPMQSLFSLPSLGGFHDPLLSGLFSTYDGQAQKACPACGSTLHDFKRTGKAGCPNCYSVFANELSETIRSIHGNVKHVGRAPARFRQNRDKQNKLEDLKNQLKAAIASENFELAVTLRDKIRGLEENQ